MKLIYERIEDAFHTLFAGEGISRDDYRIFVNPSASGLPGRYYVQVVWDGFDSMGDTERQIWVWDRLKKVLSLELRDNLSKVLPRSSREFIAPDELAAREHFMHI